MFGKCDAVFVTESAMICKIKIKQNLEIFDVTLRTAMGFS